MRNAAPFLFLVPVVQAAFALFLALSVPPVLGLVGPTRASISKSPYIDTAGRSHGLSPGWRRRRARPRTTRRRGRPHDGGIRRAVERDCWKVRGCYCCCRSYFLVVRLHMVAFNFLGTRGGGRVAPSTRLMICCPARHMKIRRTAIGKKYVQWPCLHCRIQGNGQLYAKVDLLTNWSVSLVKKSFWNNIPWPRCYF